MAGARKDAKLQARTARADLKARHQPYWVNIAEGIALGYRRGRNGGAWYCRVYEGDGSYKQGDLGSADDYMDANGQTVLTFYQAQEKARNWARDHLRALGIGAQLGVTVKDSADRYLPWYRDHRKAYDETKTALDAHILPKLGDRPISELKTRELRDWLNRLAAKPRRRRTRMGKPQAYGEKPETEDAKRARRATANRVLSILKAILNRAFEDELVADDSAWRKVKPFKGVDEPVIRFLTTAEATRLLNACPAPFRSLVAAALHTGARYSELTTLTAGDFNPKPGTVYFRPSKSGRGRHVPLSEEGLAFFKQATAGRASDALIFSRADDAAWGKNHQVRPLTEACKTAKISPAITFHELRHTYASALINEGVELPVISKLLGHADPRITMRHYAHLADKTLRAAVARLPALGVGTDQKIRAVR